jgi:hypothetical protein
MEQRRFFEAKGEESGEWLVLDGKRHPPRVICKCVGWNAPKNAALIAAALQAYSAELYSKFPFDDSDQLDEQPVVKASAEAESAPATRGYKGKGPRKAPGLGGSMKTYLLKPAPNRARLGCSTLEVLPFSQRRTGGGPCPSPP